MPRLGQKNGFFNLPPWLRDILEAPAAQSQPVPVIDSRMGMAPGMGPGPGPVGQQPSPMPPPPPQMTYGDQEQGADAMRRLMFLNMPAAMAHGATGGNMPVLGAGWDAIIAGARNAMDPSVVQDPNDPMARYHMHLRDTKEARGLPGNAPITATNQSLPETALDALSVASIAGKPVMAAGGALKNLDALPFGAMARLKGSKQAAGPAKMTADARLKQSFEEFYGRVKSIAQRPDINQDTISGAARLFANTNPDVAHLIGGATPIDTGTAGNIVFMTIMKRLQAEGVHVPMGPLGPVESINSQVRSAGIAAERDASMSALEAMVRGKPPTPVGQPLPPEPTGDAAVGMSFDEIQKILGAAEEKGMRFGGNAKDRVAAILGSAPPKAATPTPPPLPATPGKAPPPTQGRAPLTGNEPDFVERLTAGVQRDQASLERGAGKATTELPVSPVPMPAAAPPVPAPEPVTRYDVASDSFSLPPGLDKFVQVRSRIGITPDGKQKRFWDIIFKDPEGKVLATSKEIDSSAGVIGQIEKIARGGHGFNPVDWNLRPGMSASDANDLVGFFTAKAKRQVSPPLTPAPGATGQAAQPQNYNVNGVRLPKEGLDSLLTELRLPNTDPVTQKARVMEYLRGQGLSVADQKTASEAILGKLQPKMAVEAPKPTPGNAEHPVPTRAPLEPGQASGHYTFGGEKGVRLPQIEVDAAIQRAVAKGVGNEKAANNVIKFYLEKAKNITPQEKAYVADRMMARVKGEWAKAGEAPKPPTTGTPPVKLPDAGPRPKAPAEAVPVQSRQAMTQTGEKQVYMVEGRAVPKELVDPLLNEENFIVAVQKMRDVLVGHGVPKESLEGLLNRFGQKFFEMKSIKRTPTGELPAGVSAGLESPVGVPSMAGKKPGVLVPKKATATDILNELGGGGDNMDRPYAWYTNTLNGLMEGGSSAEAANREIAYTIAHAKRYLKLSNQQITQMDLSEIKRALAINRTLPRK